MRQQRAKLWQESGNTLRMVVIAELKQLFGLKDMVLYISAFTGREEEEKGWGSPGKRCVTVSSSLGLCHFSNAPLWQAHFPQHLLVNA
jgi:hypothetical protein